MAYHVRYAELCDTSSGSSSSRPALPSSLRPAPGMNCQGLVVASNRSSDPRVQTRRHAVG